MTFSEYLLFLLKSPGYYAQVANLAEVREQVQQYIPVMSRPLVLSGTRIFTWTPVYTAYSVSKVVFFFQNIK